MSQGYLQRLDQFSNLLANGLVRWRAALLVLFALITVILGVAASHIRLDPGFTKSIPLRHPYMQTYAQYSDTFGGANVVIVALMQKEGDIFNPAFFKALGDATNDVLFVNGVNRSAVTSLFTPNVNFVASDERGFVGYRVVPPDFQPTPGDIARVRSNLLQSQHLGKLVSHEFRGALIRAELVDIDPKTGETLDYDQVGRALEEIRQRYSNDQVDVRIIGFAKFINDVIDGAQGVIAFFAIATGITAVLLWLYSGSLLITLLVMLTAITAVVWQLGLIQLLGFGVDPLSILVPFLILTIGVSHAIQMTNNWKADVLRGIDSKQAAHNAFDRLFIPGATALISDAVGFAVIMMIDIPIIHELGVTASVGVALMLLTNKFMLPVLLSYGQLSPATCNRLRDKVLNPEKKQWRLLANFARRDVGLVAVVTGLLLGGWGYWMGKDLIIGDVTQGASELWPDSRYNRDLNAIVSNFDVGADELTVIAELPKDGCVNHTAMTSVDRFVWAMENVPGVQGTVALSTIIKQRTVGNSEGNLKFYGLPRNPYALGSAMRSMELSERLFNDDCTAIPVRIFLQDHRAQTLSRSTQAVKAFDAGPLAKPADFRLASGPAGVMAATNEAVTSAETIMLAALWSAVGLLVFLTFLSWRATLCVLVPLMLVSLLANAVMVVLDIGLKVSTLPVVALGVGVAVDYGIYLLSRTQAHLAHGKSLIDSYYQALCEVGTAVAFTAITMTIGVATWYFSALKFQSDMGILLAYMFFANMLGALVVLPGLAAWLMKPPRLIT